MEKTARSKAAAIHPFSIALEVSNWLGIARREPGLRDRKVSQISHNGMTGSDSRRVGYVAELGEVSRFARARQLMGYGGIVASEHSSGEKTRRGAITKTGNAHLRRVVVEAAWAYRHRPGVGGVLRKRQEVVSADVREIAWKAQHRLHTAIRS